MINNKKLLWILWVIFAVIIVWLIIWRLAPKAHAGHCNCNYPTPTVEPSILPSVLPTVSPCQGNIDKSDEWMQDCITPSLTPVPTAGQSGIPQNNGGGGTTPASAPAPVVCTIDFAAPIINKFTLGTDSITYYWLESDRNIDKWSIIYGKKPDEASLVWGLDNLVPYYNPVTGYYQYTINGIDTNTATWGQVWGWKNGCVEKSNIFDPKR